jgi:hypothetical protein
MKLAEAPRFQSQTIPVPPGYPQPAGLFFALIGQRGSSKTTLAARLIHLYFAKGWWNRLFLTSPTYSNNRDTLLWASHNTLRDDDVYVDPNEDRAIVESIQSKVRSDAALWEAYEERREADRKRKAGQPLTLRETTLLSRPWNAPPVPHPKPIWLIDDAQASRLLSSSKTPFVNAVLRNRHWYPRVPVAIIICCQSLRGGIQRPLRSNVSCWACFATLDKTVLKDLWREISGHVSEKRFNELFHYATSEKYTPLVIDLTQRDGSNMFRKGLDGPFLRVDESSSSDSD